jgi:hypothetical protein
MKLHALHRSGLWLRRLRVMDAKLREAVTDAAADALQAEIARVAGVSSFNAKHDGSRIVGSASAEDAAREFGTLSEPATPWLAPVLPLAREPMRAAAQSAAARAVSSQRKA